MFLLRRMMLKWNEGCKRAANIISLCTRTTPHKIFIFYELLTVACNVNNLRVIFSQLIQLSSPGPQQGISALESRHGAQTHRQLTRPLQSLLLSFKDCPQLYTQRKLWLFSLWWDKVSSLWTVWALLRAASCEDLLRIDWGEISITQEQETYFPHIHFPFTVQINGITYSICIFPMI